MGKKKQFINKKSAASFHIVHRTAAADDAADASASLSSLSLSSSAPPPASSSLSSYYFQPSTASTVIPAGFPVDLLVAHNEELERAMYVKDRRTARQRERDSVDPSLLPHEYDYSAHLKEMGGGLFIAATGAATYDSAASKRERQQREQSQQRDVRSQQPTVPDELDREVDWEMVHRAEREGRKRKRAGEAAAANMVKLPLDMMLALEDDERVTAEDEEGQLEELDDDFVIQAMKGNDSEDDNEGGDEDEAKDEDDDDEEEVEDEMIRKMREYEMAGLAVDEEGEEEDWEEEGDEADEYEVKSGNEEEVLSHRRAIAGLRSESNLAVSQAEEKGREMKSDANLDDADSFWNEDGEEFGSEDEDDENEDDAERDDEVRPLPTRALDKDFDRLLSDQYGDDDIGGLDDVDESLVSGQLSIDAFTDSLDSFLSRQSLPVSQGGSDLSLPSAERDAIKRRMLRRLRAMEAEDGQEGDIEQWMSDVYKEVVEDGWDVESIVSTYSNTENHPTAISEKRSNAAIQQAAKRRQQAQAALATAITHALQPSQHDEDEDGNDSEEESEGGQSEHDNASRNLGAARPRGESAEEKRARKAAMKAEKRDSRQRKKQLKQLYVSLEHTQQMQHTKASVDNPVGRHLI